MGGGRRGARRARSVAHAQPQARSMVRLELGGRTIAERGGQALGVVDLLDEGADAARRFVPIAVERAVDRLGLERLHEALGLGTAAGITDPAHALGYGLRLPPT